MTGHATAPPDSDLAGEPINGLTLADISDRRPDDCVTSVDRRNDLLVCIVIGEGGGGIFGV